MGDIVGSEGLTDVRDAHRAFNDVISTQNALHAEGLVSPLTITLGDEFQGLFTNLSAGMSAMRTIRYRLLDRKVDCRFVLGLVTISTDVNTERAWNMLGIGLGDARTKLERKRSGLLYQFFLGHDPLTETLLDAIGAGLVAIEQDWTEQQANNIIAQIEGATSADLAREQNVTKQAISKVRRAGKYDAYVTQWQAIERALDEIDKRQGLA